MKSSLPLLNPMRFLLSCLLAVIALSLAPGLLEAQAPAGARQMRHFWHVFAAFGIAWILVFGWAVSIARRLARVEEKLNR